MHASKVHARKGQRTCCAKRIGFYRASKAGRYQAIACECALMSDSDNWLAGSMRAGGSSSFSKLQAAAHYWIVPTCATTDCIFLPSRLTGQKLRRRAEPQCRMSLDEQLWVRCDVPPMCSLVRGRALGARNQLSLPLT